MTGLPINLGLAPSSDLFLRFDMTSNLDGEGIHKIGRYNETSIVFIMTLLQAPSRPLFCC